MDTPPPPIEPITIPAKQLRGWCRFAAWCARRTVGSAHGIARLGHWFWRRNGHRFGHRLGHRFGPRSWLRGGTGGGVYQPGNGVTTPRLLREVKPAAYLRRHARQGAGHGAAAVRRVLMVPSPTCRFSARSTRSSASIRKRSRRRASGASPRHPHGAARASADRHRAHLHVAIGRVGQVGLVGRVGPPASPG